MSFSSNVKGEIAQRFGNGRHCEIAEIAAILNMCGYIGQFGNKFCIKIQVENVVVARKYFTLLQKTFKIGCNVTVRKNLLHTTYLLTVTENAEKILLATGILSQKEGEYAPILQSICCRRAYLRGAFLAVGSISDPEKNYHLEFVVSAKEKAERLQKILQTFSLEAKIVTRKEHFVVYLKEGEQIADFLNIIESHVALLEFENIRVLKEMRNSVNRKVNCETANLNKTVAAAIKQVEDIQYLQQNNVLGQLPQSLLKTAEIRLEYPEASLKELGLLMTPSVGRSGMNHRLKKISAIADTIRKGKGDFAWQKKQS